MDMTLDQGNRIFAEITQNLIADAPEGWESISLDAHIKEPGGSVEFKAYVLLDSEMKSMPVDPMTVSNVLRLKKINPHVEKGEWKKMKMVIDKETDSFKTHFDY